MATKCGLRDVNRWALWGAGVLLIAIGLILASNVSTDARAAPDAVAPDQTTLTLYPVADAYVRQTLPTTNYGSETNLDVQNWDNAEFPDDRRSYVGFNLSRIPSNAIITSAGFKAYLSEAQGLTSVYVQLRRVTSSWAYNTVTWNNKPSSTSYSGINVGTQSRVYGWDVTSLVQNYWKGRNFGTSPNFGLELRGPESGSFYLRRFNAWNAGSNSPSLIVSYRLPTPTPTATRTPTQIPPEVDIWFVEGCDRSYPVGSTVNIRYQANVNDIVQIRSYPSGDLVIQHAVTANQLYGFQATITPPPEQRRLEAVLLNSKVSGECHYTVWEPSPTPTSTPSPTRTPTATPTPSRTSTVTPTATRTSTPTRTLTRTPTATQTSTPTPTHTSTPTLTSSPTPSPTPTPTSTPAYGTVRGRVILERRSSSAGANVEIAGQTAITDASGEFTVDEVPAGTHTITIRCQSYLRTWRAVTVPAGGTVDLPNVTLLAGDVDQDGLVEAADGELVGLAWDSTAGLPTWDERCDVTDDGVVNILDMVAVQFNWNRTAPGPWAAE